MFSFASLLTRVAPFWPIRMMLFGPNYEDMSPHLHENGPIRRQININQINLCLHGAHFHFSLKTAFLGWYSNIKAEQQYWTWAAVPELSCNTRAMTPRPPCPPPHPGCLTAMLFCDWAVTTMLFQSHVLKLSYYHWIKSVPSLHPKLGAPVVGELVVMISADIPYYHTYTGINLILTSLYKPHPFFLPTTLYLKYL